MGLDMYLNAEKFIGRWSYKDDELPEAFRMALQAFNYTSPNGPTPEEFTEEFEPIGLEISVPVGYWRKANAIHAWFVKNVQGGVDNCNTYPVPESELKALRNDCNVVLGTASRGEPKIVEAAYGGTYTTYPDATVNVELAEACLPSQSGFFFGDTAYGEGYIDDLENTVKIIDRALTHPAIVGRSFTYRASW